MNRWSRWGAGVLALLALEGCGLFGSTRESELQRELNRNRRHWEAQAIDDYRYVGRRGCYCGNEVTRPVVVEVRDGEVVSVAYQESGGAVEATYAGLWPAMEGVFDILQDALDQEAVDVTARYDADHGFPEHIAIDYSENVVDEELAYTVEDFQPLDADL
jgi:hypothetical protein